MITLKNISFSYNKKRILQNININFERGKIYTILGVNGSGKTTLLNIAGRLLYPNSGEIYLENKEYSNYSKREFAKRVAFLPQTRDIPSICVYELISHGRFPHLGFSRNLTTKDRDIIDSALSLTNLQDLKNKNLTELSGGERQRAYIGMLLAQESDFVLLDEPTTYLDPSYTYDIFNILKKMKADNKCIILVLHDIISSLKISDKIILLNDGYITQFDSPKKLIESNLLKDIFNIECINIHLCDEDEYIIRQKLSCN